MTEEGWFVTGMLVLVTGSMIGSVYAVAVVLDYLTRRRDAQTSPDE